MASNSNRKMIRLESSDKKVFIVSKKVAVQSGLVASSLMQDDSKQGIIPIYNVNGKTLAKVIAYCRHLATNVEGSSRRMSDKELENWEREFLDVDLDTLYNLVMAANYMDISKLLHSTCQKVANMIKGKSPEENRQIFNIANDFHKGEEDMIMSENRWANVK